MAILKIEPFLWPILLSFQFQCQSFLTSFQNVSGIIKNSNRGSFSWWLPNGSTRCSPVLETSKFALWRCFCLATPVEKWPNLSVTHAACMQVCIAAYRLWTCVVASPLEEKLVPVLHHQTEFFNALILMMVKTPWVQIRIGTKRLQISVTQGFTTKVEALRLFKCELMRPPPFISMNDAVSSMQLYGVPCLEPYDSIYTMTSFNTKNSILQYDFKFGHMDVVNIWMTQKRFFFDHLRSREKHPDKKSSFMKIYWLLSKMLHVFLVVRAVSLRQKTDRSEFF